MNIYAEDVSAYIAGTNYNNDNHNNDNNNNNIGKMRKNNTNLLLNFHKWKM